ncbi:GNAT family N-acetyltransferase [Listeria sp. FSL L7-1435]|nr:GNAT family N-acetyltransferase [Listeria cossartiae subsp. cossartiae]MBC1547387.1 GNAT family N-acetyltransferase [Listeria cossartiae subsp. cossartiae]MBC1550744.1 GNAT family N-acetyltransferase [Listeria cossartiae subsp. cossartiae]MBC1569586.1 GNAT family N-acetyltransferase [Listeria cossartiae subsp. cossartiae]MBC1572223.1 GNAT family N-acetyltransferase [Listeria cossartiae subsp. cossartiae]
MVNLNIKKDHKNIEKRMSLSMSTNIFFQLPATISTERTTLRKTSLADASTLFDIWSDNEVAQFMNIEKFSTILQAEEMIQAIENEPNACRYTIFTTNDSLHAIGSLGINDINKKNQTVEIGYELAKSHWRQGLMFEILTHFFTTIKPHLPYKMITAKVLPENIASIKLLKKLGFELSTTGQELDLHSGKVCEISNYQMLLK